MLTFLLLLFSFAAHGQRALLVEQATEYDERAVVADELRHDHRLALALTDSALRLWIALDDKLETARLLQYRAYLASRLGRTAEALGDVQESLRLYAEKKARYGVPAGWFVLGRIYLHDGNSDSAVFYTRKAVLEWQRNKQYQRLFAGYNQLCYLLLQRNELAEVEKYLQQAQQLFERQSPRWHDRLDYYYVGEQFYTALKQWDNANEYRSLFQTLQASLQADGIEPRGYITGLK
jgi:tetratricopeptide (TPR) repeat protein